MKMSNNTILVLYFCLHTTGEDSSTARSSFTNWMRLIEKSGRRSLDPVEDLHCPPQLPRAGMGAQVGQRLSCKTL